MSDKLQIEKELSDSHMLTQQQIESYQKDGHIFIEGLASRQVVDAYRPIIGEEVRKHARTLRPLGERDTYGKAFIQVGNIWVDCEAARPFIFALRYAKLAADLMGVSGVRMYHDQALYKEPGGGHTPWHQDQIYWPVDTANTITMWMPLVDIPPEAGSMTFASGSHHRGYINKMEISDQSHKTLQEYITHEQFPLVNYGPMKAGDATFHAGWTLHSAPGNPSPNTREVMTVIYVADGSRVLEPDSNARRNDLNKFMAGKQAGDLIDGPLTPLMYSRN